MLSVAADMLNDQVVPFFDEHELRLLRVLTDIGTKCCGLRVQHEYQLYLAMKTLTIPRQRLKALKQMEYVKDFTEQYK